jgi:hypothetical protein
VSRPLAAQRAARPGATRRAALAALAAAVAAAGCGEVTFKSTAESKEQAASAVRTWLGACAAERGEAVLDPLPRPVRKEILAAPDVRAGCERIADLTATPEPTSDELRTLFEETKVEHVEVDGGIGMATLRAPDGRTSELDLETDRGRWQLSNPPLAAS